ncbi:MAG: hypothetical protein ACYTBJ_27405 [Planctomycetota bacterium]|jgi:hypothetical protein
MMNGYRYDMHKTGYGEYRCIAWRFGKLCFTARGRTESESQQNVINLIECKDKDKINGQRRAGAGDMRNPIVEKREQNKPEKRAENPPKQKRTKCTISKDQHLPPRASCQG